MNLVEMKQNVTYITKKAYEILTIINLELLCNISSI